ncbi:MAG TPA: SdrD B-like domain-containing protein [Anaerolineales bacterium]|nr:SdrD B-like domain-containing protein [Anaerolineales bacterium]
MDADFYKGVVVEKAAIGDFVWHETNRDGVQDAGERGVGGVTVHLLDCTGNILAETFTDANGFYLFSDLMPGDYNIHFVLPGGYLFSPQDIGDDAFDSDADTFGFTACTTLAPGETDLTWEAGIFVQQIGPGTGTPGYWKNHPEAWPVEQITIGSVIYTKSQAIWWMEQPDGDKTITLFRALVAAKLNVLIGNDASCIATTIAAADAWFAAYGPVGSSVHASSDAWSNGEPLYDLLDLYNNGGLCAPPRDCFRDQFSQQKRGWW